MLESRTSAVSENDNFKIDLRKNQNPTTITSSTYGVETDNLVFLSILLKSEAMRVATMHLIK